MQLENLLVADAASASPDGKFYLHGAGITRFNVLQTPATIPLGVFVRFMVAEDEPAHGVSARLLDPAGESMLPAMRPIPTPAPPEQQHEAGEERYIALVLNMIITIKQEGLFHFQLDVDGELVRDVPIPAVRVPLPPGTIQGYAEIPASEQ